MGVLQSLYSIVVDCLVDRLVIFARRYLVRYLSGLGKLLFFIGNTSGDGL